jgi:hypothetical protein
LAAPTAQQPLERQKSAIARNDRALVFLLAVLVEATVRSSAPSCSPQAAKGSVLIRTGTSRKRRRWRITTDASLQQICCAAFRFLFAAPASIGHFLQHICFFIAMRHTFEKAAPSEVMRLSLVTNLK